MAYFCGCGRTTTRRRSSVSCLGCARQRSGTSSPSPIRAEARHATVLRRRSSRGARAPTGRRRRGPDVGDNGRGRCTVSLRGTSMTAAIVARVGVPTSRRSRSPARAVPGRSGATRGGGRFPRHLRRGAAARTDSPIDPAGPPRAAGGAPTARTQPIIPIPSLLLPRAVRRLRPRAVRRRPPRHAPRPSPKPARVRVVHTPVEPRRIKRAAVKKKKCGDTDSQGTGIPRSSEHRQHV